MNPAIIDYLRALKEPIPPEVFEFRDPESISVRTNAPKWTWIARVCHEIPKGKCVVIPVPENYHVDRFVTNMRSALAQSNSTKFDRFTIRRSRHERSVAVMKSGTWQQLFKQMESQS